MRWLAVLVVSAAGVALAAAGILLLRDDGPEELLPDLDQDAPSRLEIVEEGDSYRLVFASAVDNVGRGPLLVEGERPDGGTPALAVRQLVRSSDGTARARDLEAEMRFSRAESHDHWHLLAFATYELRSVADNSPVRPGEEIGFCLGDRRSAAGGESGARPVWTDGCGLGQPGLLLVREGITPGFGTDYGPDVDGQFVDVTNVPAGRYLLVHRSNAGRVLEESDYENNAASVLIQLRRSGAIPTVRVLGRCPDSEACRRGDGASSG